VGFFFILPIAVHLAPYWYTKIVGSL